MPVAPTPPIEGHRHTYYIDPPGGPTSQGHCACGVQADFFNSTEGAVGLHNWREIARIKQRTMTKDDLKAAGESQRDVAIALNVAVTGVVMDQ
jgi:hypothetical protein